VAWQATTIALVGAVVGIPIGILNGRELWTLFAQSINAVPDPTVPVLSVIIVGVGSLVFANLWPRSRVAVRLVRRPRSLYERSSRRPPSSRSSGQRKTRQSMSASSQRRPTRDGVSYGAPAGT